MAAMFSSGSSRGRTGANSAAATTIASQAIERTPPTPSRCCLAASSAVGATSSDSTSSSWSRVCVAGAPSPGATMGGAVAVAEGSGSGMADPRVEHAVEDVDQHVDEHVADGDERHQALQRDVLPGLDRLEQQGAEARQREEHLHDHRTAD